MVLGPGEVLVDRDIVTDPGQRLTIRAGTRVLLKKGVGIYARGLTLVQGEPGAWVEFLPADENVPWGAFGVSGAATKGSRFEYMRVRGGSVGTDGIVRYKGMFNVYDCPGVVLRHCEFGENMVGDDTVNLAESRITVENSRWENARADGLDLDMCRGVVRDSVWLNSGNDGLDLMGCRVKVERCRFEGSGDKGVSVGEGSQVLIENSEVIGCNIGIESKDASRALVVDTLFDGNTTTVHSYQKKWMYSGGGTTALVGCRIENSVEADAAIEKRSKLILLDTRIESVGEGSNRVVVVDDLGHEWGDLKAME